MNGDSGSLTPEKRCTRCGATLDRCTGHEWARPQEVAVCMGFDAFRICIGQQPRNFSVGQVRQWLENMT